jgi:hypothetical protein
MWTLVLQEQSGRRFEPKGSSRICQFRRIAAFRLEWMVSSSYAHELTAAEFRHMNMKPTVLWRVRI